MAAPSNPFSHVFLFFFFFTVKTPDGFYGRIYTYGFYDSCFYDGNGGTVNVLRISRANGIPRCGTQQFGDAMTNIVVVQFNDYVQTSRDKVRLHYSSYSIYYTRAPCRVSLTK